MEELFKQANSNGPSPRQAPGPPHPPVDNEENDNNLKSILTSPKLASGSSEENQGWLKQISNYFMEAYQLGATECKDKNIA